MLLRVFSQHKSRARMTLLQFECFAISDNRTCILPTHRFHSQIEGDRNNFSDDLGWRCTKLYPHGDRSKKEPIKEL